jgi:branched-chain amino acid transport system substrate-binding protein
MATSSSTHSILDHTVSRRSLLGSFGALFVASLSVGTLGCSSAASSEPYKIGGLFAVTGFNSPLGTPEKQTALLMEEQINKAGGINGRQVKLVIYDTESDETKAVSLAKKLIEQDKVLAIIGPSSTGESMALIDTMEKAEVPLISCAASIQIVQPVRKWVFKMPQSDSLAVSEIFGYLKAKGLTKVALLTSSGGYGTTGKAALDKAGPAAGITFVAAETFADKDTDMTVQLTKIKGSEAQALIVWGTNPGPAIIAKNMKQLGMTIPLLNSHGIANRKFIELAGDAANGVVFPAGKLLIADSLPDSDAQKAVLTKYAADFKAKYNADADTFGGHAYDAFMMVTKAIEKAGGDKAKIRDEIEKTQGFVGTGGIFNISAEDHNGLGKGSFVMVRIADGKWTREQ